MEHSIIKGLAEYIGESDSNQRFTKKFLVPKEIKLIDGHLKVTDKDFEESYIPSNLLVNFVNLNKDTEVLEFAQKYGFLGVSNLNENASYSCKETNLPISMNESISIWRQYISFFRALLNLTSHLQNSSQQKNSDVRLLRMDSWQIVFANNQNLIPDSYKEKEMLDKILNFLLLTAGIRPQYDSWKKFIELCYPAKTTLFSALVMQLANEFTKNEPIYTCNGCGKTGFLKQLDPFRDRKPRKGYSFFCEDCRKNDVPKRMAEERYKEKQKVK